MLKIEQFVKQQYGIVLSKKQIELIALIAANPTDKLGLHNPANTPDTVQALKSVMAYLQDGLSVKKDHDIFADLNAIYPDWQHVKLTKAGYIQQRNLTLISLKTYIESYHENM